MTKTWRVPILTYHAIDRGPSPLFTPPEVFEGHLRTLEGLRFRTLTLAEALRRAGTGEPPPERSVVLTFDDGYETVATEAWPRLRARGFGATLFLVSEHCGRDNRWPSQSPRVPTRPLLDWEQAGRLAADGAELGAHSRTHPLLSQLPESRAEDEMAGSRADIESRTGQRVRLFAYPYGESGPSAEAIARRHFEGAVSTDLGLLGPGSDPFHVPRLDSHYVSPAVLRRAEKPVLRLYLTLRQALRAGRRRFVSDWNTSPDAPAGDE